MFDWEKYSGVGITKKFLLFLPPALRIQILPAGGGDWSTFEIIARSTRHNAMA
jgi:hypothetical protein